MERERLRDLEEIREDGLWPIIQRVYPDPEECLRYYAVWEVLSSIPEEDYLKLKTQTEKFSWFIPHYDGQGMVAMFPAKFEPENEDGSSLLPCARVFYLSPRLENNAFSIVLAIVAHELAHIVLGHKTIAGPERYGEIEKEARELINKWGFEKEAKRHAAYAKSRLRKYAQNSPKTGYK